MALSAYLLRTAFDTLTIGPLPGAEIGVLIAVRFLTGLGARAVYALAGGVMGDVWQPEQRGTSLGVAMIAMPLFSFPESHGSLILRHRAVRLRRETGHQQYHTAADRVDDSSFGYPNTSSLWISQYHEPVEISGLNYRYIACSAGELLGSQIGGPLTDYLCRRRGAQSDSQTLESRLTLLMPTILISYLGVLLYGWSAAYRLHWLVIDVGVVIMMFGLQLASLFVTAYIMNSYGDHTSSAMAANQFVKSLAAFLFPLFGPSMYHALG
ncbi:major facilitator superfamily domain-containing protein [Xylariaceae sp. FL0804]|nr:major facilitator superfamily domain-containing protein [Xylariaceae sp. FL0804]